MDCADYMGGCKSGKQAIDNPDLQRQSKACKFHRVELRSGKNRLAAFLNREYEVGMSDVKEQIPL